MSKETTKDRDFVLQIPCHFDATQMTRNKKKTYRGIRTTFAVMENKSIYFIRKADQHPAIQNLRKYFRDYLSCGGTRIDFANKMGMSSTLLNQYLGGIYKPTRTTIVKWAQRLGTSYEEIMVTNFEYIKYPLEDRCRFKQQSRRITINAHNHSYDMLLDKYLLMSKEGEVPYSQKIVKLIESNKM